MREKVEISARSYRQDRDFIFEEPVNAMKTIDSLNDTTPGYIAQGEPVIDSVNNRILLKKNGKLNKLSVINSEVILEEI